MTKKTNKQKTVKTPSKSKTKKALPVAWEKLKGRGPFPSVAAEAYFGKSMKKK